MKLTLTHPLYRRLTPSNELEPMGYIADGMSIEVVDVVFGKSIDGNSIWYKAGDNMYYWSGGFEGTAFNEFSFENLDFLKLSQEQQYALVSQALVYYYRFFKKNVPELSGASVMHKIKVGQYHTYYALSIQVRNKNNSNEYKIPPYVLFKGYKIPTDVIEAEDAKFDALGDKIFRGKKSSFGSSGFYATTFQDKKVLVTNYHVVADDCLRKNPCLKSIEPNLFPGGLSNIVSDMNDQQVGKFISGRLDLFNDVALIELDGQADGVNVIPSVGQISGCVSIPELLKSFSPGSVSVKMFGAASNKLKISVIESFNSSQTISYIGGNLKHDLHGLIVVRRISIPGDSGSAIVDFQRRLIGIVVASDNKFSYVLPIDNILSNFNLKKILP